MGLLLLLPARRNCFTPIADGHGPQDVAVGIDLQRQRVLDTRITGFRS